MECRRRGVGDEESASRRGELRRRKGWRMVGGGNVKGRQMVGDGILKDRQTESSLMGTESSSEGRSMPLTVGLARATQPDDK